MENSEIMFVYGSLVNSISRNKSGLSNKVTPAKLVGYECGWHVPVPEDNDIGLGVIKKEDGFAYGVLVDVTNMGKRDTDLREKQHGYNRVCIPLNEFVIEEQAKLIKNIWVYVVDSKHPTISDLPISQSYIDVVLSGYLEISSEYAIDFIKSIKGWDKKWINDRREPHYRRYIETDSKKIDHILKIAIPDYFSKRENV